MRDLISIIYIILSASQVDSLSSGASIITADLHAIIAAVRMSRGLMNLSVVICHDCHCFASNQKLNSSHPVVKKVQDRLTMTSERKITLCWVPAHVAIRGNREPRQLPHTPTLNPVSDFVFCQMEGAIEAYI